MSALDQPIGGSDQWEACPAGELSRMVQRVEAAQRRERMKQVYGTALASTALFAFVVLALGSFIGSSDLHGGISCSECRSHFAEYQPHITSEKLLEDTELVASMQMHLEKCSFCKGKFEMTYPGLLTLNGNAATRTATLFNVNPLLAMSQPKPLF